MAEVFTRFEYQGASCRLSAIELGDASKQPVILLHGMRDHGLSMLSIAECLADEYYVIAVDLRGHGHSENTGVYMLMHFFADLRALINVKNLNKPILVGHSLGGHIASRYTSIYGDEVKALLLLDGMGPPELGEVFTVEMSIERARMDIDGLLSAKGGRSMVDNAEAQSRLMRNNPRLLEATAKQLTDEGVEPHPAGGVRWRWDAEVNSIWQSFSHEMADDLWRLINCPVLIVTGDEALAYWAQMRPALGGQDKAYGENLERRRTLFKQATHKVISGAGHMLQYDQPDALNLIVSDFVKNL